MKSTLRWPSLNQRIGEHQSGRQIETKVNSSLPPGSPASKRARPKVAGIIENLASEQARGGKV